MCPGWIAGSLVVSQVLTLFSTPVIYLWFDRARLRFARWRRRSEETEIREPEAVGS